ncbi:hypothetical protein DL95DRAFT_393652 [Leptodontidium sp. 2 PMI_412]|nr:hypothetical protein DL95DRAFT_393652 [Leptodontidium sp. 2 PMI_412]
MGLGGLELRRRGRGRAKARKLHISRFRLNTTPHHACEWWLACLCVASTLPTGGDTEMIYLGGLCCFAFLGLDVWLARWYGWLHAFDGMKHLSGKENTRRNSQSRLLGMRGRLGTRAGRVGKGREDDEWRGGVNVIRAKGFGFGEKEEEEEVLFRY